jgi:HlyD family secretion protein
MEIFMHSRTLRQYILAAILLIAIAAAIVFLLTRSAQEDSLLRASGTVETIEIRVASELAGRVTEVNVQEGDLAQSGEVLFRLDDTLYQAQKRRSLTGLDLARAARDSAQAAVETANTAVNSARLNAEAAQMQHEIALNAAHMEARPGRILSWQEDAPREFLQPAWYFQKDEKLDAAELEMNSAKDTYEVEKSNLESVLERVSQGDMTKAKERLRNARSAFLVADELLTRAKDQRDKQLEDFAQSTFDSAKDELEAAQSAYQELLSEQSEQELLEARARVAVAQERYDTAVDQVNQLRTGEDSLKVAAAELAVKQAEAAVAQAEAQLAQAQANLQQAEKAIVQAEADIELLDIQIGKLVVYAPASGLVQTRNVEPGEVLQAGSVAMTIDQLDTLTITVYIPEDRYGQIHLGDHAGVTVDSFPDKVFDAVVTRIADRAEFTPRNVQTEEGRRTTVFAIELSVIDLSGLLMPGMPADVTFGS